MILSICAFISIAAAVNGCFYVRINGQGVGLFSFEDPSFGSDFSCTSYSSRVVDNFDSGFKAARAFGVMAYICIGIGMILTIMAACMEFSPAALKGTGMLFMLGSIFALITFSVFSSFICGGSVCDFYAGAGLVIVTMFLAVFAGLVCFKLPPAKEPTQDMTMPAQETPAPGTETTTEVVMPDGTKKITKTTVNADGSKTVEETVTDKE